MCCAVLLAFGLGPRLALVLVWIFDDRIERAFDSWVWPLLGLLLLPWTTLMYILVWARAESAGESGSSSPSASCSTSPRTAPAPRKAGRATTRTAFGRMRGPDFRRARMAGGRTRVAGVARHGHVRGGRRRRRRRRSRCAAASATGASNTTRQAARQPGPAVVPELAQFRSVPIGRQPVSLRAKPRATLVALGYAVPSAAGSVRHEPGTAVVLEVLSAQAAGEMPGIPLNGRSSE